MIQAVVCDRAHEIVGFIIHNPLLKQQDAAHNDTHKQSGPNTPQSHTSIYGAPSAMRRFCQAAQCPLHLAGAALERQSDRPQSQDHTCNQKQASTNEKPALRFSSCNLNPNENLRRRRPEW